MSESSPTPPVKPVISAGSAKRANASVIGMLLATFSTVAIVLAVVLLNPHPNASAYRESIDVQAVSGHAADTAGFIPAAPVLPEGWSANYARWNTAGTDGVAYWEVGYVTPNDTFIALHQSITANPTWTATQAENAPVTGTRAVDGHEWELRDKPEGDRSLIFTSGTMTIVLTGAADFEDFDILAAGATSQLAQEHSGSETSAPSGSTPIATNSTDTMSTEQDNK